MYGSQFGKSFYLVVRHAKRAAAQRRFEEGREGAVARARLPKVVQRVCAQAEAGAEVKRRVLRHRRAQRVARAREGGAEMLLLEPHDGGLHLRPHRLVGAVKARVHLTAVAVGHRSIPVTREVRFRLPEKEVSGVNE